MRYLLFGGDMVFEENGGWGDFVTASDSTSYLLEQASQLIWWEIVDLQTNKVIMAKQRKYDYIIENYV